LAKLKEVNNSTVLLLQEHLYHFYYANSFACA